MRRNAVHVGLDECKLGRTLRRQMSHRKPIPVPSPFEDVADVVAGLCLLQEALNASDDRRGESKKNPARCVAVLEEAEQLIPLPSVGGHQK